AITAALKRHHTKAAFFFTGRFYRNPANKAAIGKLQHDQHYLGPHSNEHLLYADWNKRDSLLVTREQFETDLQKNLEAIAALGIDTGGSHYFIPPYEWWNDTIAAWARQLGWHLANFTPGVRTNADYTWPQMGPAYKSSSQIMESLKQQTLDGDIILIHAGVDPRRKDKLYNHLDELLTWLQSKGYRCVRLDELL